jgi:hypothetical protein
MLNWRKTIDPLSNDINLQITPPSPLKVATCHGELPWCFFLADFASPRGKSASKTRRLAKGWGGERYEWRLGLAHFHNEYSFLMISPNLHDIWPMFC